MMLVYWHNVNIIPVLTTSLYSSIMVNMNRIDTMARAQIIRCLAEGNSIRSTVRITGTAKNTVVKLLLEVAEVCRKYQDNALRNLTCKRLQLDEIWSFVYAKEKNASEEQKAHGA